MKSLESCRASVCARPNNRDKFAFATLVMLDDGYIPGALLLAYSLRIRHADIASICMVTPEVSDSGRKLLRVFFDHVVEVKKLYIPCRRMKKSHYLPYVFTKINAMLLGRDGPLSLDIDKVLFIDADVLPFRNYHQLGSIDPPAGIINEYKSNLIMVDKCANFRFGDDVLNRRKWHWHKIYDPICPHGKLIPEYITGRVRENPNNMGIHGALVVLEASVDEYERIIRDIEKEGVRDLIKTFCWPEMQYLTLRWSGRWRNIDARYCGLKGYPALEILNGTHFAGVKPWKILDGRNDLLRLPDFRCWYNLYLQMYGQYRGILSKFGKYRRLSQILRERMELPEEVTMDRVATW